MEHVIFLGYQQNIINVVASSLIFYHRPILISFSCEWEKPEEFLISRLWHRIMERGALLPISGSARTQRPWLPGPRWFRKLVVSVGCYIVISWARQLELELQNRSQQRRTGLSDHRRSSVNRKILSSKQIFTWTDNQNANIFIGRNNHFWFYTMSKSRNSR